jgi:LemA protein
MGNRKGCCAADMQAQKRRTDDVDMLLHDELAETENRIAVERQRSNDAVHDYNSHIGLFPSNTFAGCARFQRNNAHCAASEASREVPKVRFPGPGR